jgi:hypothetical protein
MKESILLTINDIKPIILKFRLLELLTLNEGKNFGYKMTTIFYRNDINQLIYQLKTLIIKKNKDALQKFISFCYDHQHFIEYIGTIFPYNQFNKNCIGSDFKITVFYIELLIKLYENKTNFYFIFDHMEFNFIFEKKQNNRYNPILILNEENNLYLSEGTGVEYNNNNYELNSKDNVSEKYTIYTINGLKEYKCKTKPKTI